MSSYSFKREEEIYYARFNPQLLFFVGYLYVHLYMGVVAYERTKNRENKNRENKVRSIILRLPFFFYTVLR